MKPIVAPRAFLSYKGLNRSSFLTIFILFCLFLPSAQAEIEHSTLSPHLAVIDQSLSGITFHLSLPQKKGNSLEQEKALIAIPPGKLPQVKFLQYSYTIWATDGTPEATGPIDIALEPRRESEVALPNQIVSIAPLGLVRDLRLALLTVRPYHTSKKNPKDQVQIHDLTFRLEFSGPVEKAPEEPEFPRDFPSGFRGIFNELLANAKTLPLGKQKNPEEIPSEKELPYNTDLCLKLATSGEGYYFLSGEDMTPLSKERLIPSQLALFYHRLEIPFAVLRYTAEGYRPDLNSDKPLKKEDGILFFAPLSTSPYDPESVFFLTPTGGEKRFQFLQGNIPDSSIASNSTSTHYRVEENKELWEKKNKNKDKTQHDYWIWQAVRAENPFSHTFILPGPLETRDSTATLKIRMTIFPDLPSRSFHLQGFTFQIGKISLSGEDLEQSIDKRDREKVILEFAIPVQSLNSDQPILDVKIQSQEDYPPKPLQGFCIDSFEFIYERRLRVQPDGLRFQPRSEEFAWELENPSGFSPQDFLTIARSSENEFAYLPADRNKDRILMGNQTVHSVGKLESIDLLPVRSPAPVPRIELSYPNRLKQPSGRVDYLLITHPMFLQDLQPLVDFRREQGYRVQVVSSYDIYKEFGDGSLNPESIRSFLQYTYENWGSPRPTYVVLVGDARWDYWGYFNLEIPNLLPSYHPVPAYAGDNWYACVSGEDSLPDYLISRLSVSDSTAAQTVVQKIIQYETQSQPGPWQIRTLFLSDTERIFEDETLRQIEEKIPDYLNVDYLQIRDYPLIDDFGAPEARRIEKELKHSKACNEILIDRLNQGLWLWEYYGHGSPNVFAKERVFFAGDTPYSHVKRLNNRSRLPFLIALTCDTIQFDYAGEVGPKWRLCIGEELLSFPEGGAIGVYGASGRGYTNDHVKLNDGFHDALFIHGFRTLGELVTVSKLLTYADEQNDEPVNMFGLLGDALTTLPLPKVDLPVSIQGAELFSGTGGELNIEVDLSRISSQHLQLFDGMLTLQDPQGKVLFEEPETQLTPRKLKYLADIPPDTPAGTGRVIFHLYPRSLSPQSPVHEIGASEFTIKPEPKPSGFPLDASPDLSLEPSSIRLSPPYPLTGETVFIDVDIANRGKAPAFDVGATPFDGPPDQGGGILKDSVNWTPPTLPWILPGETRTLRLRWDTFQNAGWHDIYVKVDARNQILESDETNNSASQALYVRTKMDLTLDPEDFFLSPLKGNSGYTLKAAVRNIGEVESEPCRIQVDLYDRPEATQPANTLSVNLSRKIPAYRMNPKTGKMGGGRVRFEITLPPSTVRFEMMIDPEETLYEETQKNNRIAFSIQELLERSKEEVQEK